MSAADVSTFPASRIVRQQQSSPRRRMKKPQPKAEIHNKERSAALRYAALLLIARALGRAAGPAVYVLAGAGLLRFLGY